MTISFTLPPKTENREMRKNCRDQVGTSLLNVMMKKKRRKKELGCCDERSSSHFERTKMANIHPFRHIEGSMNCHRTIFMRLKYFKWSKDTRLELVRTRMSNEHLLRWLEIELMTFEVGTTSCFFDNFLPMSMN
jgi:hypothetical protein